MAVSSDLTAVQEHLRAWFPSLTRGSVLLENAGGSQVPAVVAEAMRDYMLSSYVQLEAGYPESDRADAVVERAHAFVELLMGGGDAGRVVLGPSTSQLVATLAASVGETLEPGDEVVVSEAGHEANVGPWARLERRGAIVRTWPVDPVSGASDPERLAELVTPRTRVVALVHVSNLLGEVLDVPALVALVRERSEGRARVIVDGVAFAPHRAMDVAAWGVDWYVYSTYKVYGPHMAALWGRHGAWQGLPRPNHFFVPEDELPYAFELGGVNHEGCAGLLALGDYLRELARLHDGGEHEQLDRAAVLAAFELMEACERPLQARLLDWLAAKPDVRVVGPGDGPGRVPTVAFVHARRSSVELAAAAHRAGIGVRHGHNYAHRLASAMGLPMPEGPLRISAVHYNTPAEIERVVEALDPLL